MYDRVMNKGNALRHQWILLFLVVNVNGRWYGLKTTAEQKGVQDCLFT